MARNIQNKCRKELLEAYHTIQPIRPINKVESRFAYKIFVKNKPIAGEWALDGVNISKGTFIYKRLDGKCRR